MASWHAKPIMARVTVNVPTRAHQPVTTTRSLGQGLVWTQPYTDQSGLEAGTAGSSATASGRQATRGTSVLRSMEACRVVPAALRSDVIHP